jgi:hypothetical protein
MGKFLKQAQEMQKKLGSVQEKLGRMEVEGTAGGGMVKAVVNGKKDLISVAINPEVVDPAEVEMLQDLITAAVRQACENAEKLAQEEMSALTGGIDLPGLGL